MRESDVTMSGMQSEDRVTQSDASFYEDNTCLRAGNILMLITGIITAVFIIGIPMIIFAKRQLGDQANHSNEIVLLVFAAFFD
jgi:hypothetical protein